MIERRQCGGCTLCCRLMPMKAGKSPHFEETVQKMIRFGMATREEMANMLPDFDKPAVCNCPHQRSILSRDGPGCAVYHRRPFGCRFWNCRWLVGKDTADLRRPDLTHYVIDLMEDFVTENLDNGKTRTIPVVQIWCDPAHRDAHRDPALRKYLNQRGKEGFAALIRYGASEGFVLFPPSITGGEWIENHPKGAAGPEHTMEDRIAALGNMKVTIR